MRPVTDPKTIKDRGAVLGLLALILAILVMSSAIALDLSARTTRGQQLQNAADAAALAGVTAWQDGDQVAVEKAVDGMLEQNGVADDDVSALIVYLSDYEVQVTITDPSPPRFLAPIGLGSGTIDRTATAYQRECQLGCTKTIVVPPPLGYVKALGTGDGFLPIPVGDRYYAINHHSSTVSCVDKVTNARCWGATDVSAFPLGYNANQTMSVHHPERVGTKIYYTGTVNRFATTGNLILACFETVTNTPCSSPVQDYGNEGQGTLAVVDDKLYVFTSAGRVHCFDPVSDTTCFGYAGGIETSAKALNRTNLYNSDRLILGSRIYHSVIGGGAAWVQCFDVAIASPCSDFAMRAVGGTVGRGGIRWALVTRLLFARDTAGTPTAVCTLGDVEVGCYDLGDGNELTSIANDLEPVRQAMVDGDILSRAWTGLNSYHPPTNRLFAVDAFHSMTYCFDFNTLEMCGSANTVTPLGATQTYGYIPDGNCLIGLGDNSIFHSMKPDLSGECDSIPGRTELRMCSCAGLEVWPTVDIQSSAGVSQFSVRVLDADGVVVRPKSGMGWVDLFVEPLDLSDVPPAEYLTLEFQVTSASENGAWIGPEPKILVTGTDRVPALTD